MGLYDRKIEKLIEQKDEVLQPYRDSWIPPDDLNREINKVELEDSITKLYKVLKRERPIFIWVESPWQAVTGAVLLQIIARGGDLWLKSLAESLPDALWSRAFAHIYERSKPHLEQLKPEAIGRAWFNTMGSSDGMYRDLILRCDSVMRQDLGIIMYGKLRNILYKGVFESRRNRWRVITESRQLELYLHTRSGNARTRLRRFTRTMNRPPQSTAAPEPIPPEEGTLEAELIFALPDATLEIMARKFGFRPENLDYSRASCTHILGLNLGNLMSSAIFGLQWSFPLDDWLPLYSFPIDFLTPKFYEIPLSNFIKGWQILLANHVPHLFFDGVCFLVEKPIHASLDNQQQLHSETTTAIEYSDGFSLYSWHGVTVPPDVILRPESITVEQIENEKNAEVRRVLLERFGEVRYLEESGVKLEQEDSYGSLYRKVFDDDEPLVMVRVKNSTPEADGTFRTYYLRVPPTMLSAHEAVAWTFDLTVQEYHPNEES